MKSYQSISIYNPDAEFMRFTFDVTARQAISVEQPWEGCLCILNLSLLFMCSGLVNPFPLLFMCSGLVNPFPLLFMCSGLVNPFPLLFMCSGLVNPFPLLFMCSGLVNPFPLLFMCSGLVNPFPLLFMCSGLVNPFPLLFMCSGLVNPFPLLFMCSGLVNPFPLSPTAHKWFVKSKPADDEHIKQPTSDICKMQTADITELGNINSSDELTASGDKPCNTQSAATDVCVPSNGVNGGPSEHSSVRSSGDLTLADEHKENSTQ